MPGVFTKSGKVFRIFGNRGGEGNRRSRRFCRGSGSAANRPILLMAETVGLCFPLARAGARVLAKRPGEIVLSSVADFVGDLFDRKIGRLQQLLCPVHPEPNQQALR